MGPKRPQNRADSVLPCARNRGAEPFWPKIGGYKTRAHARARDWASLAYFSGARNRGPNAACGPADRGSGATQRAPKLYWGGVLELISIFCLLDSAPNAIRDDARSSTLPQTGPELAGRNDADRTSALRSRRPPPLPPARATSGCSAAQRRSRSPLAGTSGRSRS